MKREQICRNFGEKDVELKKLTSTQLGKHSLIKHSPSYLLLILDSIKKIQVKPKNSKEAKKKMNHKTKTVLNSTNEKINTLRLEELSKCQNANKNSSKATIITSWSANDNAKEINFEAIESILNFGKSLFFLIIVLVILWPLSILLRIFNLIVSVSSPKNSKEYLVLTENFQTRITDLEKKFQEKITFL